MELSIRFFFWTVTLSVFPCQTSCGSAQPPWEGVKDSMCSVLSFNSLLQSFSNHAPPFLLICESYLILNFIFVHLKGPVRRIKGDLSIFIMMNNINFFFFYDKQNKYISEALSPLDI